MKQKLLLLTISLFSFIMAKAIGDEPGPSGAGKNDLNGTVVHAESKKPLEGVSITAVLVSKKEKTIVSDEEGGYAFDDLKPGTYKFIFEKAGYKKITKEKVIVKTDEGFQLNIEMIEQKEYEIMPSSFGGGGF